MIDSVNEENIKKLIGKIPHNLTPLEKVVVSNEGTVQTLLSVLFRVPIKVEIISQIDFDGVIFRWSKLIARYAEGDVIVCLAESVIKTDLEGFNNGIREKNIGIGQLISSLGLETGRKLVGFHSDDTVFSRVYEIEKLDGAAEYSLKIAITEIFYKSAFAKVI